MAKRVKKVVQCKYRIIMLKISAEPVDLVINQHYMPTSTHTEEEIDEMHEDFERLIDMEKGKDNIVIMVDRNAVVEEGIDEKL